MQLAIQPITRAQQPLAAYWQWWQTNPCLRLGRWLCTSANRPILHDYLLSLSTSPSLLQQLPLAKPGAGWLAALPSLAGGPTKWLDSLLPNAEQQLHSLLASSDAPRLLVLEDVVMQPLRRLARWFPATVTTYTPAVSMQQVLADIRQLPPTADTPASNFQHLFYLLTKAIEQGNTPTVLRQATACLNASIPPLNPDSVASVWLAVGHYYLAQQQAREALIYFAKALLCAEAAYSTGNQALGLISMQVWLSEAAAWKQLRRGPQVVAVLRQAVARAGLLPPTVLGIEAARQLGLALHHDGQPHAALASYQQGLQLAERLPPGQRPSASLQALGDAYHRCLRTAVEKEALYARLTALLN